MLSIAFVPDYEQAAFACLVNYDGEPLDYLRVQNITKYKTAFKESDRLEKVNACILHVHAKLRTSLKVNFVFRRLTCWQLRTLFVRRNRM